MRGVSLWNLTGVLVSACVCAAQPVAAEPCSTPPTFAGLVTATNAASGNCTVQLSWAPAVPSCGGAIRYAVHRGTSPGFTPTVENRIARNVFTTSFTDDAQLTDGQTYFYLVRASELGARVIEDTNTVVQSSSVSGPSTYDLYFDDFDGSRPANASAYWSASSPALAINTCGAHSPTHAYWFGAASGVCTDYYPSYTTARLVLGGDGSTPGIDGFLIPSTAVSAVLRFEQSGFIEAGYDFVHFYYSETGAEGPWTLKYTYTGLLGAAAFDFTSLAGKRLWFAWEYVSDGIVEFNGVSLDDIRLTVNAPQACVTYTPPPRPATNAEFTVQPSDTVAGSLFGQAVSVSIYDAIGQRVQAPQTVRLSLFGTAHGASLLGTVEQDTVEGVATFGDLAVDRVGQGYVLRASVAGLDAVESAPFDVDVATSARMVFVTQPPAEIVAGTPFGIDVEVQDAFGNLVSGGAPVTVAIALEGGSGSLGGDVSVETVDGVARFDALVVSGAGRGLTLRASANDLIARTSPFTVAHAPASALVVDLPEPVRQGRSVIATLTAYDAFGNVAKDDQRSVVVTSTDTRAQLPAPTALYDGRAQVSVVFGTSGAQTLTATYAEDSALVGAESVLVAPVDAPTVTLLTPREGEEVGDVVQIIAAASVGDGTAIASLAISVDGVLLQTGASGILSATWDASGAAPGTSHVITAEVIDEAGNAADATPLTFTIATPPSDAQPAGGGCAVGDTSDDAHAVLLLVFAALVAISVRRRKRAASNVVGAALVLGTLLVGCADDDVSRDKRGERYCEILVGTLTGGNVEVAVYSTEGLSECPDDDWSNVTVEGVLAETGALMVVLNGPRYWMLDSLEGSTLLDTDVVELGGISMRQAGALSFPLAEAEAQRQPYTQHTIRRDTRFVFDAEKPVFELVTSAGEVFTMQSYSTQIVPQTEASLASLASVLELPEGMSFRTRVLEATLEAVSADGTVTVMQDELGNTYLRTSP